MSKSALPLGRSVISFREAKLTNANLSGIDLSATVIILPSPPPAPAPLPSAPPAPPPPPPPIVSINCAKLNKKKFCKKRDRKMIGKRCGPNTKPKFGGVGHKKCARLCQTKNKKLSDKCKQACCDGPKGFFPSLPPTPPQLRL